MTATLDRALLLAADRLDGIGDGIAELRRSVIEQSPTPAHLAARFDHTFVRTAAVDLVAEQLRDTAGSRDGRLVISVPPQELKTTSLRWAVFWLLIDDPTRRVVFASYAASLARTSGRVIRNMVETYGEHVGLAVDRSHADASDWQIEGHRGGLLSVGVGGSLTGRPADCVTAETAIMAEHGKVTASQLAAMPTLPKVLSWNHALGRAEWRQVQATRIIPGREVVELRTAAGRTLRCTADHRVYVDGRGYVPASELRAGDRLQVVGTALPRMQHVVPAVRIAGEGQERPGVLLEGLPERRPNPCDRRVRALREDVLQACLRGAQGGKERLGEALLLGGLHEGARHGTRGGASALPNLQRVLAPEAGEQRKVLLGRVSAAHLQGDGPRDLRPLLDRIRSASLRVLEEAAQGPADVLLEEVRVRRPRQPRSEVQALRHQHAAGEGKDLLLDGMSPRGRGLLRSRLRSRTAATTGDHLPHLRADLPAEVVPHEVLRSGVRGVCAQPADDRDGELPLQGRHQLRRLVREDAAGDFRAGRGQLRRLQREPAAAGVHAGRGRADTHPVVCASHQPRPAGQPTGEPDPALPVLPHGAPQVGYDTVSVVLPVRGGGVPVYDFQVEGNRNFFAGEVLVHNCLIIDDPLRNQQDADSPTIRGRLHEWWEAVARTRLAPGAPVIVVQTRWHEDDLAGRRAGEGWPVLNIPALADGETPDALNRKPGEYLVSTRGRTPEDWAAIRKDVGERVWASLFQGRPSPLEGGVFQRAWFDTWRVKEPPTTCQPPVVVVDPADGGRDEAGVIVAAKDQVSGRVFILDDLSGNMTIAQWARLGLLTCARRNSPTLAYEKSLSQLPNRIKEAWQELYQQATALRKADGDLAAALKRMSRADDSMEAREQIQLALAEIVDDVDAILAMGSVGPRRVSLIARGAKDTRMMLVAPAFETGRAVMVGTHAQAEWQLTTWQIGMDSPDRADAVVHAVAMLAGISGVSSLGRSTDRVPTNSTSLRNKTSSRITRSTRR